MWVCGIWTKSSYYGNYILYPGNTTVPLKEWFKQMPRCTEAPLGMRSIRSILSPLSADLPPVKPTYLQDFHILTTITLEGHVFYLITLARFDVSIFFWEVVKIRIFKSSPASKTSLNWSHLVPIFQVVGATRDVVCHVAGDATGGRAMHGIGAEEAVLHGAVFKETVADGAHHVEMERIPGDEGHTMWGPWHLGCLDSWDMGPL